MEGVTLPNNVDAVLDQIEAQQTIELAPNGTSLDFFNRFTAIHRCPFRLGCEPLPLPCRMNTQS